MIRTDGNTLVVNDFAGVNTAIDEVKLPPNMVPWSVGGYYTNRKEFERLLGKKPVSTATTEGMILTIMQMNFRDHSVVLFHASTQYCLCDDLSSLRSAAPVSSTLLNSFLVP